MIHVNLIVGGAGASLIGFGIGSAILGALMKVPMSAVFGVILVGVGLWMMRRVSR